MAENPQFTRDEYQEYLDMPDWAKDSPDFESVSDYDAYWVREVKRFKKQYDQAFEAIVAQWQEAIEYVESVPAKSFDVFVPDVAVAQERIPFALISLMEVIALLYSNYPQPLFVSPAENQDQYAAAANQFTDVELKANSFNSLMFDVGVDVGYAGLGVLKTYVDYDQVGPFGQEGKIIIQKIDPMKIAFDPKAKRLKWADLGFILVEDFIDLGTARKMFKASADRIESFAQTKNDDTDKDGMFGNNLVSPVPNPLQGNPSQRNRVKIIECWLKDDRLKFEADIESVVNRKFVVSEDGGMKSNPDYDEDKPEIYTQPVVDDDGYVVGKMVPAYPDGRCIITADDKCVVEDFANPFWHKQAPFVFFRGRPGKRLATTGDLTNIIKLDRKINDIYARVHTMCQNEIERPMIAETNTFRTPRAWFKMSGQSTAVLVKNPGREFGRLPFMEIPQFVWVYLAKLEQALDRMMAVAGVMRGQLTEGSQLSAEAVSSLQGMATTMLKMKAELVAEGVKDLAYQVMWLERETYPQDITTKVTLPDGTEKEVKWHDQDPTNDYLVDIQSGTGLPGAHEQQLGQVLPMLRAGIIDDIAAMQMLKIRGWQQIVQRKNQKKLEQIEAQATGKALGLQIKQFEKEKQDDTPGALQKA